MKRWLVEIILKIKEKFSRVKDYSYISTIIKIILKIKEKFSRKRKTFWDL